MADPATTDIDLGVFNVNSVDRIRLAITKDGVAWTGIDTVKLVFEDPDGNEGDPVDATLEAPDAGVWYYDTTTSGPLDATGRWRLGVKITDATIVKWYPFEISFQVNDQP